MIAASNYDVNIAELTTERCGSRGRRGGPARRPDDQRLTMIYSRSRAISLSSPPLI
jgi:hypothetical protein